MVTLMQTLQTVLDAKDPHLAVETKRIFLKEVLQAYVLDYLYNHPQYRRLNFYGGACLERNFEKGRSGAQIKGRDFYDLLWFMQKNVRPLEEKLERDGTQPYTARSAMQALQEKIAGIKVHDLVVDLLPMFESRAFIEAWLETFHQTFERLAVGYLGE